MEKERQTGPNTSDEIEQNLTKVLTYSGYILVAFELVKSMIVGPIKSFYQNTTFNGGPFQSYENDVLTRSKNEFEACLLYLKDFTKAINAADIQVIQSLREHRNDLAHNLAEQLDVLYMNRNSELLEKVKNAIFKLSNYRAYVETGQDSELKEIDWNSVKGHEFLIIENIINNVKILGQP